MRASKDVMIVYYGGRLLLQRKKQKAGRNTAIRSAENEMKEKKNEERERSLSFSGCERRRGMFAAAQRDITFSHPAPYHRESYIEGI